MIYCWPPKKVDLDSPKVATMDEIAKGKKVYCRCWLSDKFPLCDGAHAKHNEATGDNVGPLIVSVAKEE
jgi:CDGSH-type Zn-finger protein